MKEDSEAMEEVNRLLQAVLKKTKEIDSRLRMMELCKLRERGNYFEYARSFVELVSKICRIKFKRRCWRRDVYRVVGEKGHPATIKMIVQGIRENPKDTTEEFLINLRECKASSNCLLKFLLEDDQFQQLIWFTVEKIPLGAESITHNMQLVCYFSEASCHSNYSQEGNDEPHEFLERDDELVVVSTSVTLFSKAQGSSWVDIYLNPKRNSDPNSTI